MRRASTRPSVRNGRQVDSVRQYDNRLLQFLLVPTARNEWAERSVNFHRRSFAELGLRNVERINLSAA
jgi:hypothetical protein